MDLGVVAGITDGIQANVPTWDLLVLGFFGLGSFLYGFTTDRKQTVVLFASFYIPFCIANNISTESISTFGNSFFFNPGVLRIVVFLALFVLLFFLLSPNLYLDGPDNGPLWQTVIFSIGLSGLLLCSVLSLLPDRMSSVFGETVALVFLSPGGKVFWFTLPVFCLTLLFQKRYWD